MMIMMMMMHTMQAKCENYCASDSVQLQATGLCKMRHIGLLFQQKVIIDSQHEIQKNFGKKSGVSEQKIHKFRNCIRPPICSE